MRPPQEACPKCGAKTWSGPTYHCVDSRMAAYYPCEEWLAFSCMECGFKVQVPCLDAPEPDEVKV